MKTERNVKRRLITGVVLFAISLILLMAARYVSGFAQWYTDTIYPVFVESMGRVSGLFSFSITEVLLYILILVIVIYLLYLVILFARKKGSREHIWNFLSRIFLVGACLMFLYSVNCGINYHHTSFSESTGIVTETYTAEELKAVCVKLTEDVNERCNTVERNADGVMQLDASDVNIQAVNAMERLGEVYPEMEGYYPRPKGLLLSWILSIQNLTGVYSPFTIEANYNDDMTDYNIPFTVCHELSHLRGFMQEEEANFIGYLACMQTDDEEFQYSGSLMGWIYCMNVLHKVDAESWEEVRGQLDQQAEADLAANHVFWEKYDGRIAEVSNQVNDTYLKANGQQDGVKSYDRMVDLMVAYYAKG